LSLISPNLPLIQGSARRPVAARRLLTFLRTRIQQSFPQRTEAPAASRSSRTQHSFPHQADSEKPMEIPWEISSFALPLLTEARRPSGPLPEGVSTIVGAKKCRADWGSATPMLWTVFPLGVGAAPRSSFTGKTPQGPAKQL